MPTRFDLDQASATPRRTIDAAWSPKKKAIVSGVCVGVAAIALIGGATYAIGQRPPSLPKTAEEAVAVLSSDRFAKLDQDRQSQYATAAAGLLRDLPREQREALMQDEETRRALGEIREQMMEDIARKFARGEEIEWPRPPRDERTPEERRAEMERMREQWQNMSEEDRAARMDRMREMANSRINDSISSGNAQTNGLMAEMFKRGGARGGPGGRGGGGGGRGRGG